VLDIYPSLSLILRYIYCLVFQGASSAAKLKLTTEIAAIGEIKTETETARFYVDYDDLMLSLLKEAAQKMINTCNEYQKRHGKKTLFEIPEV
ncbi:hemolysin E, partial [Escherichia coli]